MAYVPVPGTQWPGAIGVITWNGIMPGDYFVHRTIQSTAGCDEYLPFTIASLGTNCGNLSGRSWYKLDPDCFQDFNEVGIPNSVFEILPGPEYVITDANGNYSRDLVNGNYTITQLDASLIPGCGISEPWPFTNNSNAVGVTWVNTSTEPLDLEMVASAGAARPGFDQQVYGVVRNLSPQLSGPVTVVCNLDADVTYVSANPTPTSAMGSVVTWNFPALVSFATQPMQMSVHVPVGTPLGTDITHTFTASNTFAESTAANNSAATSTIVTGSFDPNDKAVLTSTRQGPDLFFNNQDEYLDYSIRFQNTGTDTAFTVVVTDTIDADLDLSTYEQGVASHSFMVQFLAERVVKWTFSNILLPDSNTNEALSHGLVSFRIKPVLPLLPGTVLRNNADIFFDFNPPVRTNDAVVMATQALNPRRSLHHYRLILRMLHTVGESQLLRAFRFDGQLPNERAGHIVHRSTARVLQLNLHLTARAQGVLVPYFQLDRSGLGVAHSEVPAARNGPFSTYDGFVVRTLAPHTFHHNAFIASQADVQRILRTAQVQEALAHIGAFEEHVGLAG